MNISFWQSRWSKNDIAFHEGEANSLLLKTFHNLNLKEKSRILIPMCGKTKDIGWFLSMGFQVVGVELIEMAVEQLFSELNMKPEITGSNNIKRYSSANLDIFAGDFFEISSKELGHVDAVYDRAAIVALPERMRVKYASHLIDVSKSAPQLVITYIYNQSQMQGPPFSVDITEMQMHYEDTYRLKLLEKKDVPGGLKNILPATENAWLLSH